MVNAPSLANCNYLNIGEDVKELIQGGVSFFHIDIMDGHYVANLCFPAKIVANLKDKYPNVVADVHLMVTNPGDYLDILEKCKADYVSFHIDGNPFVRRIVSDIKNRGMKAGVVINPSQRIDILEPYIHLVDYVVLMTVEPGFAGQKFLDGSLERLAELVALKKKCGASCLISIDGGVDYANGKECVKLGADILVTGIDAVFQQDVGLAEACKRFEEAMQPAVTKSLSSG